MQCAKTIDRVEGVLRASGGKATARGEEGGDKSSINADRSNQAMFHQKIVGCRETASIHRAEERRFKRF